MKKEHKKHIGTQEAQKEIFLCLFVFFFVPLVLLPHCLRPIAAQQHGDRSDPRTDDIIGDLGANGQLLANWGLHLIDANLAMGNLVEIVGEQTKAWMVNRR